MVSALIDTDLGWVAQPLNGVGVVGILIVVFWALLSGRLATGRELREKDRRIATLEEALDDRDRQMAAILNQVLPTTNQLLRGIHEAAEEARDE